MFGYGFSAILQPELDLVEVDIGTTHRSWVRASLIRAFTADSKGSCDYIGTMALSFDFDHSAEPAIRQWQEAYYQEFQASVWIQSERVDQTTNRADRG